ncbi:MAG: hypothetical protein WKI04_12210 [Ferruginibacter sp.]
MKKLFYLVFALLGLISLTGNVLIAQKPVKTSAPPASKPKKPLVKSWLGTFTGTGTLDATEAGKLITLPLKITDINKVDYAISSYQLVYTRIGVTENEETGKTSPQTDIAASRFTVTPLPPVWQTTISEGLHTGEELYFFDIIVFDKQGRRFFAPELKIMIK